MESKRESSYAWFAALFFIGCFGMTAIKAESLALAKACSALSNGAVIFFLLTAFAPIFPTLASHHYTEKQLEALAIRVGKTYWVAMVNNRTPSFLSAPAANASSFRAPANESFEITDLVGQKAKNPYFKVRFASGKEGYIRPEAFIEEFNMTLLTVDPQAEEKRLTAAAAEEEKKRVEWIRARPWPQDVKDAAIKRRVGPGLTAAEVKHVLGNPARVIRVPGQRVSEEHWHYADGSVLVFQNRLLSRVEKKER